MREIKFRAWDDSPVKDGFSGIMINHEYITQSSYLKDALDGKYSIMQFIGLKDKNGKDIYEGDILKIDSEKLMVVGWSEKFASFTLNREGWMFSHWFGESCDLESCVVVGNIHENPELL